MATRDTKIDIKCYKFLHLSVNMILLFMSALVISVGTVIYAEYCNYQNFIYDRFFAPASLLIAIGVIVAFISLFGCVGSARESTAMVNIHAIMSFLVIILGLAAVFAEFSLQTEVKDVIYNNLKENMGNYTTHITCHTAMNSLQENLQCCGATTPSDWKEIIPQSGNVGEVTVPSSCMKNTTSVNTDVPYYTNGCYFSLGNLIAQSLGVLGTGAMAIAFIQFIGIIFAIMLAKTIRRAKTEREHHRQEIIYQVANIKNVLN